MNKKELNKKLCITLPQELIQKIDDYSTVMNVTRTSAICFLINKGLIIEEKDN